MKMYRYLTVSGLLLLLSFPGFAQQKTHIVKKGETLYSVARTYNVSVKELAGINHFSTETHIKIGQKLVIPDKDRSDKDKLNESSWKPLVHIVQKGETLYGIARKYKTTIDKIAAVNRLENNLIFVGQKLTVNGIVPNPDRTEKTEPQKAPEIKSPPEQPVRNKNEAVITIAAEKKLPSSQSDNETEKKKVVSTNKNWPATGDVYYFRGKIPGIEIDIKGKNDVVSVCNGIIKTASAFRGYGHVVVVETYNNMLYTYAGFDSIVVKEGDTVKAGEKLGEMHPSDSHAPRIYLFVYQNGTPVNPVTVPRF